MNFRYIRSTEDRKDGEYCIDLLEGVLAPSWGVRNLVMYYMTSDKLQADLENPANAYKRQLFMFWKDKNIFDTPEEEESHKRAKEMLTQILQSDVSEISLAVGSEGPTYFSDIFLDFWDYIESEVN